MSAHLGLAVRGVLEHRRFRVEKRRAAEKYSRLFEDSLVGIYQITPDGRYLTANPALAQILGYDSPAQLMASVGDVGEQIYVDPNRWPELRRRLEAEGAVSGFESQLRRQDGGTIWVSANARAVRNEHGSLVFYEGTLEAIIARKLAETALRQREERLRVLADATPNGLIIVADGGEIIWANHRAEVLFGFGHEQLLGRSIDELVPSQYRAAHLTHRATFAADHRVRLMGDRRDLFGQRQDGSEFPVEIGLSPIETSQGKLTLASIIDTTARLRADAALRLSEERFAKAFRASPAALTMTRLADGFFVDVNDQFLQLLGYARDEVIGHTSTELRMFPDPADRFEPVRRLRAEGTLRNFEMDLMTKTGDRRNVLFSMEQIALEGEAHALAIMIDNTERRRAEEALRQLNAELEQRVQARTAELAASEAKFRTLFDVLPVGVSILDAERRVVDSNPALARILQMSTEVLATNPYASRKFVHADGTPVPVEEFPSVRVLEERRPILHVEMGVITETGDTIWIDVSAAPLPLAGFSAVIATADLTERKRIEADLRQSEERFAKTFHSSPLALTVTRSADRLFIDVNEAFLALFGYRRDEIVGHSAAELNFVPDVDERAAMMRHFNAHGVIRNYETVRRTKSDALRNVLLSADSLELNGEAHTLSTMLDITARKQAEAAVHASEAKFRALFDVLPVGVSILDDHQRVIDSNPALARILQLPGQAPLANTSGQRKFIHPDGTPMQPDEFPSVRVLKEHRPILHVEMGVISETGDTIWTDVSAAPLPLAGFGAVIATADLTDRKRIEAALGQSEEKFSKAFHASATGIILARTGDGQIIEVNDSFLRMTGYRRDEILGRTPLAIGVITSADRERIVANLRQLGHAREMEIGLHTKSGEVRTALVSIEAIMIGAEPCSLSINQDITDRKRAEQALANERDLLQALMDNVPDTIYFKDRASRFTRVNLAQAGFLGLATPELAIGKTDADFQAPHLAGEAFAEEQRLLASGQPLVDHLEFNPTPSREPRWLSATKVPLKDASGQVVGLVGIARDITARVKAEEDLQRLNHQLAERVDELSVLNRLAEQLQSCLTVADTFPLMAQFMRQLFPRHIGALYLVSADRSEVTTAITWGVPALAPQVFAPGDCWSLRRGQIHLQDAAHQAEPCLHMAGGLPPACLCMPLLAHGEALGVLHLRAPDSTGPNKVEESTQQLVHVVADSLALTWANLTLRESLRQQAIRDPLTGLFNRRFMEESLERELHRAARLHQGVSLIMMDIDRFKQVNDQFGHETGDAVLRALGGLLQASGRGSDIACRYGGEEFLLILPEAPLEIARQRAEQLRHQFREVSFGLGHDLLGPVTLSLGIAAYPQHGDAVEAVLRAADAALYRAKSEGRDRTIVAAV